MQAFAIPLQIDAGIGKCPCGKFSYAVLLSGGNYVIVGNALLEQFDVIFDFERCQMWLRPNKNFNTTAKYDTGMTLTPKTDCWVVNGLIEGGNAHKAGVKRGDIITSINGLSPEKVNIRTLKRMNDSAEDWKIVVKRNNSKSEFVIKKEKL
jgi:C-terminal processing protease CtpA/Prc